MPAGRKQTVSLRIIAVACVAVLLAVTLALTLSTGAGDDGGAPRPVIVRGGRVLQPRKKVTLEGEQGTSTIETAEPLAKKATGSSTLPPKIHLPEEADLTLRQWNAPYHEKRATLRQGQERGTGPLHTHFFFTMDCTRHSMWQAEALEMTWEKVQHGGFLSRIISGCLKHRQNQNDMTKHVLQSEEYASHQGAYFAPTVTQLPSGKRYAPYNRPMGLQYWMNHTDLTEDVFVLLDPDMLFVNRLTGAERVAPGHPVAHFYQYMTFERLGTYECALCAKPGSFDRLKYAVGPPWMLHLSDFRRILPTWIALVPELDRIHPQWIVEMVALSVACAYHKLPFEVIHNGMVDDTNQRVWSPNDDLDVKDPVALLHYCNTQEVGEKCPQAQGGAQMEHYRRIESGPDGRPAMHWFHWSKYRVPTDWPDGGSRHSVNLFDCDAPLMQEWHYPQLLPKAGDKDRYGHVIHTSLARHMRRQGYFLHLMLPLLNEMLTLHKRKYCVGEDAKRINLERRLRNGHPVHWLSPFDVNGTRAAWGKPIAFRRMATRHHTEKTGHDRR